MNSSSQFYRSPITVADVQLAKRCRQGRVIIIDDDSEVLHALSGLIEMEGYATESYDSANAYFLLNTMTVKKFPGPVCILSDVKMPDVDGLELQRRLLDIGNIPLILMSGNSGALETVTAFRAGVVDFLLKPFEDSLLFDAIGRALNRYRDNKNFADENNDLMIRISTLTSRELEIIKLASRGVINRDIAYQLGIAIRTAKLHRQRAMDKLGIERIIDLGRLDIARVLGKD